MNRRSVVEGKESQGGGGVGVKKGGPWRGILMGESRTHHKDHSARKEQVGETCIVFHLSR